MKTDRKTAAVTLNPLAEAINLTSAKARDRSCADAMGRAARTWHHGRCSTATDRFWTPECRHYPRGLAAGVQKAPKHEIAGRMRGRCRGRYGDFAAGSGLLRLD